MVLWFIVGCGSFDGIFVGLLVFRRFWLVFRKIGCRCLVVGFLLLIGSFCVVVVVWMGVLVGVVVGFGLSSWLVVVMLVLVYLVGCFC